MLVKHQDDLSAEQRFGIMVRRAREAREWTQEELRKRLADCGISLEKTAMIRLEGGKRPIRFNEVVALSQLLDIKLSTSTFTPEWHMDDEALERATDELERLEREIDQHTQQLAGVEFQRQELLMIIETLRRGEDALRLQIAQAIRYRQAMERPESRDVDVLGLLAAPCRAELAELMAEHDGEPAGLRAIPRPKRTRTETKARSDGER